MRHFLWELPLSRRTFLELNHFIYLWLETSRRVSTSRLPSTQFILKSKETARQ